MLTKAQTLKLTTRIETLRRNVQELVDGLVEHHDTSGSRHAQRMLRCAASDLDIAGSSLRLEVK